MCITDTLWSMAFKCCDRAKREMILNHKLFTKRLIT